MFPTLLKFIKYFTACFVYRDPTGQKFRIIEVFKNDFIKKCSKKLYCKMLHTHIYIYIYISESE